MVLTTAYRIKEIREEKRMSQEELAKKSGVSRSIISELETGRRKNTQSETLLKISKALDVSMAQIFLN